MIAHSVDSSNHHSVSSVNMTDPASTLLITKITMPHLSATPVARPQLQAALANGRSRKLILITTAAGFGKTTLIVDWVRRDQAGSTAWFSLDEADNDPVRFLSYLLAALQTQHPQIGSELLTALQSPQPPPVQHVLISLINQLTAVSSTLLLVLDDYHLIENDVIHTAVTFLLDHAPPDITIALLSRSDPPLPIARYRAHQQLLEIRADALRFSPAEATQFLNQAMNLNLSQAHIQALEQRTEGWIVGLQLAAIALQNSSGNRDNFMREFTGSHRFILDYLLQEVLAQQPEEVRRFLLATAVLHRLNASLCSAVTGQDDGAAMLTYLEKHNLFLVPLDQSRQWYRYHHLFADLLQTHLQTATWANVSILHRRAAHWHEAHHLPEEAVTYALAAQDFEYAAKLLLGPALGVMQRGEVTRLLQWFHAFPGGFVAQYPRLCVQFGLAFALNGRWPEAESLLQTLNQETDIAPSETLLLAFLVANKRQDIDQLAIITTQAAAQTQPDRISQLVLGFILSFTGDLASACQQLAAAQAASERDNDKAMALTALLHQCRLHALRGNLHQAHTLCQQAIQQMQNGRHANLSHASFAYVSLGRVYLEWNALAKAETQLQQTISLAERSGFVTGVLSSATMMLAEVAQARGEAATAQILAQQALDYAQQYDPPVEVVWLEMYRVRLWLRAGDGATAVRWLQQHPTPPPPTIFYINQLYPLTQARILMAQNKPVEAISLLTALVTEPPTLLTADCLALLALARQAQGDISHALLTLERALALAEPEKRERVFLDLDQPMAKLLHRYANQSGNEFARLTLANFPENEGEETAVDPLSSREMEVLQLIVAGHSNQEIADTLVIAHSTVKWYVNTLYSKLHVKNRRQAIARAREMGL